MLETFHIRPANANDVSRIAEVNKQSWLETYPEIFPKVILDNLNLERSINNWSKALSQGLHLYVAIVGELIVGFVSGGINRSNEGCETGIADSCECEMATLYLLREYQKLGIGKALFNYFKKVMQSSGYATMVVWVAEENPATAFYAGMGGEKVDRKIMLLRESEIPEVAYRYILTV